VTDGVARVASGRGRSGRSTPGERRPRAGGGSDPARARHAESDRRRNGAVGGSATLAPGSPAWDLPRRLDPSPFPSHATRAMEATDAAELVQEIQEERAEEKAAERFRNAAALLIAIMAMLLAIGSLGGGNATDDMIHGNIKASDTWAFYQAKNVRQTEYRLAADRLQLELADPTISPEAPHAAVVQLARHTDTIVRYHAAPDATA